MINLCEKYKMITPNWYNKLIYLFKSISDYILPVTCIGTDRVLYFNPACLDCTDGPQLEVFHCRETTCSHYSNRFHNEVNTDDT